MDHLPELIICLTAAAVMIAVACYVVSRVKRSNAAPPPTAQELLQEYSRLYDAGELSREEFLAIRRTFAGSIRAVPRDGREAKPVPPMDDREQRLEELLRNDRSIGAVPDDKRRLR